MYRVLIVTVTLIMVLPYKRISLNTSFLMIYLALIATDNGSFCFIGSVCKPSKTSSNLMLKGHVVSQH